MLKRFAPVCIAIAASAVAFAEDVTVPSTYDEATDTWIGSFVALTNAIKNQVAGQTIYLSKGMYDLSSLSDDRKPMSNGAGYGDALIGVYRSNARLVGATGKPEDVVLFATNSDYRIINLYATGAQLHGVTVKGGYANTNNVSKSSGSYIAGYMAGGGVMLISDNTVVSNCHFTANRGRGAAGAISGNNKYQGTVYDSVFYGNNDDVTHEASVVARYTTMYRCVVTNNIYSGESGYAYVLRNCRMYDSLIAYNRSSNCAGLAGGLAVHCRFLHNVQPSNANNWNPGGGAGARSSTLTNCYFYGNVAYRLGGAIRDCRAVNCVIVSNKTIRATYASPNNTDSYGGGACARDSEICRLENCLVVSNLCVYGGGCSGCIVIGGTNAYNKAREGGGARTSSMTGVLIAHNAAQDYANGTTGGDGGGIAYGAATNCVFRDNACSATYATTILKNCDIADNCVHAKKIEDCVFHELDNTRKRRAVGNVFYSDGMMTSNIFMIAGVDVMRNCLVTNCSWSHISGNFYNSAVFEKGRYAITSRVENCTFADNNYYWLTRNYNAVTQQISFVNSVFTGNRDTSTKDIGGTDSKYAVFSNCVYGAMGSRSVKAEGFEDFGCTSITARAAYKFTGKEPNPYSLRRSSPLRGWGMVFDWMEDGTDYLGNPRLRDGAVDIGCYQCWLDPVGAVFSIR